MTTPVAETTVLARGSRWTAMGTLAVGGLNYAYSLLLTRLLDPGPFAVFAAGQALLLTAGTIATSAVPWVLAKRIAEAGADVQQRRAAVWFAVVLNSAIGTAAALVCGTVALGFGSPAVAAAVALSAFLVFCATSVNGWLQGERRFGVLSALRVLEVVTKAVAGAALVLLGGAAGGALAAFAVGAGLVLVVGTVVMRRDVRPVRGALRAADVWRSTRGVAAVQGLVALAVSLDVVLVALLPLGDAQAGSYQAANVLARVPLFLAGAVAVVVFPLFRGAARAGLVDTALGTYCRLVLPLVAVLVTAPPELLGVLFPPGYSQVARLLPVLAVAGGALGVVQLTTTFFQAAERYGESVRVQLTGLAVTVVGVLAGFVAGGALGIAVGAAAGNAVAAGLLLRHAGRAWPGGVRVRSWPLPSALALLAVLLLVRPVPLLWLLVAVVVGARVAYGFLRAPVEAAPAPDGRLRVLHLGFEDVRRPGSGGGALRTHEVNRRLADRFDITVLTTTWPGAQDRVEDGVRYEHVGLPVGYFPSVLSYFAVLPFVARRRAADLVVEDFAAPFSSALAPLWSRAPVLSVVQWLNAREKSRQYRLPFFLVEALGVRLQDRYVAMSDDLAEELRRRNPRAEVTVVPNGVDRTAFDVPAVAGRDVVFLGRLEVAQKGLDLLLEAVDQARDALPGRVVLVGDGPDRARVEREVARRGLQDVVVLAGRLDGSRKHEVLAGAALVLMPSRFETFGIVAVEALACGTPVLAFDIPCLRAVVPPESGRLVPAFDTDALATALVEMLADLDALHAAGVRGREFARRFDWDDVAATQGELYLRAAGRVPSTSSYSSA